MKILLVIPPVFNDIGRVLSGAPPLSLLYLASYLEKNGYKEIEIIDADKAMITWNELGILFSEKKPDIVGITGASVIMPAIIKTAEVARKSLPNAKIIVGGFAASSEPEKILRSSNKAVDVVVNGEGELTLLELVQKTEKNIKIYNEVKGISYLDEKGKFITTERREYIKDLNSIPWPAYHFLNTEFLSYIGMPANYKEMKRPTAVMLTSRGCPHRCAFCSLGSKMYRERNIKDVVDEIEFYKNKYGINSIQLYDDEFVGMSHKQNERVEAICDEIINRGLNKKLSFLVQGRCSQYINLKTLEKMREANIVWMWWGVESGSQKILDFIKKDIKVENIIKDFYLARKAGIKSMMFIMTGFPKETPADIKLTANLIKKVKPDQVRIHINSPYPGSELRKYLEERNLIDCHDYYKFDTRLTVNHHTEEMTSEEIKKYYKMLVFRFENGYWHFLGFLVLSLLKIDGWKKLFGRLKMASSLIFSWLKINTKNNSLIQK